MALSHRLRRDPLDDTGSTVRVERTLDAVLGDMSDQKTYLANLALTFARWIQKHSVALCSKRAQAHIWIGYAAP